MLHAWEWTQVFSLLAGRHYMLAAHCDGSGLVYACFGFLCFYFNLQLKRQWRDKEVVEVSGQHLTLGQHEQNNNNEQEMKPLSWRKVFGLKPSLCLNGGTWEVSQSPPPSRWLLHTYTHTQTHTHDTHTNIIYMTLYYYILYYNIIHTYCEIIYSICMFNINFYRNSKSVSLLVATREK